MKSAYKLTGIVVLGLCVAAMMLPWRLGGARRRGEIAASMAQATGLSVRLTGPITVKVLPLPRVRISGVSITDPNGSLSIEAPVLYGDLELSALMKGQWHLASATFSEPVVVADVDQGVTAAALAAIDKDGFKLSMRSGVIRLRSGRPGVDTLITDLNATAQQGNSAEGSLALSGSAVWHGHFNQFALRVADPRRVFEGGSSPAFAQVSSAVGAVSAVGDLTGGSQQQFAGRVSLSSNALPGLFKAFGVDVPWLGVQKGSLGGDVLVRLGDVSLSNSEVRLGDMAFEGTLGFHGDSGRGLFEGTLATGLLDLGQLSGHRLDTTRFATLYRTSWDSDTVPPNLDLRISANTVRAGNVEVQDAALAALFRDGRLELTLDEASAFGGTVKARAVATVDDAGLDAHADLSASGVDLGPLAAALLGDERVNGQLSGKLVVDGRGSSLFDVVHDLGGEGQVTVEQGSFTGVSVSQALKRLTRKLPLTADHSGQITTFERASAGMRVQRGMMRFVDGQMQGPGIRLSFGGRTDLPAGRVEIQAVASQTDASGTLLPDGPRLPFEMRGRWGEPMMLIEHTRVLSLPALPVPSLMPGQGLP